MTTCKSIAAAFGRFWWEFLIGENPDAFLGTLVVVGCVLLLRHERVVALTILPLGVLGILLVSTYRGRRRPEQRG